MKNKSVFSLKNRFIKVASAVFIGLFSVLIFSCSSPFDNLSLCNELDSTDGISVVISNFSNYSRSIAPQNFNVENIAKYVITGEDFDGNLCSQEISIGSSGTGTVTGLKKSFWNFTLHAYSDSNGTNEVLHGFASVDTTYQSTVAFVLTSLDLTTKGSVDLTLTYSDSSSFEKVDQINLYLCDSLTCDITSAIIVRTLTTNLTEWIASGYNLSSSNITPGYYMLIIQFYGESLLLGTYSELVDIEPGRETSGSVAIGNILSVKPNAPENLYVYRQDSSLSKDYYKAVIRWDDCSDNEEYFVLYVYEYEDSLSSTGSLIARIDKTNYQTLSIAEDGVGYAGGSLLYSSEEYALKLKTGRLYDFKIQSQNKYGNSVLVSRSSSFDIADDDSYGSLSGFLVSDSPYLHVNTMSVLYNIGGGVYKTAADEYIIAACFPKYYIYQNLAISLISPVAITDSSDMLNQVGYPVLYYANAEQDFSHWLDENDNAITQISTFHNAVVTAVYNLVSDSTIELDSSTVTVTYGSSQIDSLPDTGSSAVSMTNLSVGNYITVGVNVDEFSNADFTSYDFYLNGTKQTSVSSRSATEISGTNYVLYSFAIPFKGSYTLQVAGVKNAVSYYSSEFSFGTL